MIGLHSSGSALNFWGAPQEQKKVRSMISVTCCIVLVVQSSLSPYLVAGSSIIYTSNVSSLMYIVKKSACMWMLNYFLTCLIETSRCAAGLQVSEHNEIPCGPFRMRCWVSWWGIPNLAVDPSSLMTGRVCIGGFSWPNWSRNGKICYTLANWQMMTRLGLCTYLVFCYPDGHWKCRCKVETSNDRMDFWMWCM